MLTVAKVTAGQAEGYAEYLEGKAKASELGDYYLKDGERVEAPGRWVAGATLVGCDPVAPVGGEVLRELMAVRRPDDGQPLRPAGANGIAVAAIDATFSAPKSVSAVWALSSPQLRERIEQAHEQAVDRAVQYSLRHVAMIRQRIDKTTAIHGKAAGVIATSWRHTTARAVDGQLPDPQLHSHVLLHAATRRDGQVIAIDSRAWFVHRRELGAAYRTELARELIGMGFSIRRNTGRAGRYFELEAVPQSLLDRWSSRHHQVRRAIDGRLQRKRAELQEVISSGLDEASSARWQLEQLLGSGQLGAEEDRYLTRATRAIKSGLITRADLDHGWRAAARQLHLAPADLTRLRPGGVAPAAPGESELLRRLSEFDARFTARDARAVALEASAGESTASAISTLASLRSRGELLKLADERYATRAHRETEQQTAALAAHLAAGRVRAIPPRLVEAEVVTLDERLRESGGRLSVEQSRAIELACGERQLTVLEGQAGTGKSTTLAAVARAHQADGRQIIITSTAALAAERLAGELSAAGVASRAYSTVALHAALASGAVELDSATTVIHDEAALASTREQQQLFEAVRTSGARLIEVGDPRQSQPVGAGGLWSRIEQAARENDARVELTRNVRAHDPADRRDQALFRHHDTESALRGYASRGRLNIQPDAASAEDAALEAAQADRYAGRRTLVIAQTSNDHLDALNARAQALRAQAGELGAKGPHVPGRPYRLYEADEVQLRRGIQHPELGQLRNGTLGRVIHAEDKRILLRLSSGGEAVLFQSQLEQADVRLAYVQHPFPAQGHTSDTAHLIVADHITHEGSYVALTRARQRSHIHVGADRLQGEQTDPLEVLAERMNRSEPQVPSIDVPLAHENRIYPQAISRPAKATLQRNPQADEERTPAVGILQREDGWEI